MANKRLHTTATALANFDIIARRKCLGGCVGCVLPVRARLRLVKRSVSSTTSISSNKSVDKFFAMCRLESISKAIHHIRGRIYSKLNAFAFIKEGVNTIMITKERLKREIDKVQDGYLDALFQVIQAFEYAPPPHLRTTPLDASESHDDTMQEWRTFIEKTYGSLASDPITRGEQGAYEVREAII
jgi:hypothetical protein